MSKKTTRNVVIGVAAAAVAGYVVGILTAPKSGKETRQDIKNKAVKMKLEAEHKLKVLNTELNELIEEGKSKARRASARAKKELNDAVAKAVAAKERVRQTLSALHEGDADESELESAMATAEKATRRLEKTIEKNS